MSVIKYLGFQLPTTVSICAATWLCYTGKEYGWFIFLAMLAGFAGWLLTVGEIEESGNRQAKTDRQSEPAAHRWN